jgi:hypothetical protein
MQWLSEQRTSSRLVQRGSSLLKVSFGKPTTGIAETNIERG